MFYIPMCADMTGDCKIEIHTMKSVKFKCLLPEFDKSDRISMYYNVNSSENNAIILISDIGANDYQIT